MVRMERAGCQTNPVQRKRIEGMAGFIQHLFDPPISRGYARDKEDRQSTDADLVIERNLVPLSRQCETGVTFPWMIRRRSRRRRSLTGGGERLGKVEDRPRYIEFVRIWRYTFSSCTILFNLFATFPPPKMWERLLVFIEEQMTMKRKITSKVMSSILGGKDWESCVRGERRYFENSSIKVIQTRRNSHKLIFSPLNYSSLSLETKKGGEGRKEINFRQREERWPSSVSILRLW